MPLDWPPLLVPSSVTPSVVGQGLHTIFVGVILPRPVGDSFLPQQSLPSGWGPPELQAQRLQLPWRNFSGPTDLPQGLGFYSFGVTPRCSNECPGVTSL